MILLRNAVVLAPEALGPKDVLIAGERIVAIAEPGVEIRGVEVEVLDLHGLTLAPGLIDNHVHVLGGGGGLGFSSRAPELQTSQLVRAGITSVIGMLGFDATTKDMRALVGKTKAFREDGISAYALTGATLEHPVPTLTGRIRDDIAFVEEIIGVGEISVSELGYAYDSNGPGAQYIAEAATAGLLAGRLARKRGYLCLQVPPYHGACLKPVLTMLERTGLPIGQLLPSHVNQTDAYMADAIAWAKRGGVVDVGANYSPDNNFSRATPPAKAIAQLREAGVPLEPSSLSSDGNGAPPKEEQREGQPGGRQLHAGRRAARDLAPADRRGRFFAARCAARRDLERRRRDRPRAQGAGRARPRCRPRGSRRRLADPDRVRPRPGRGRGRPAGRPRHVRPDPARPAGLRRSAGVATRLGACSSASASSEPAAASRCERRLRNWKAPSPTSARIALAITSVGKTIWSKVLLRPASKMPTTPSRARAMMMMVMNLVSERSASAGARSSRSRTMFSSNTNLATSPIARATISSPTPFIRS